jgi:hypothetical protein
MVQSPLDQDPPNPLWSHPIPHEKPNCPTIKHKALLCFCILKFGVFASHNFLAAHGEENYDI